MYRDSTETSTAQSFCGLAQNPQTQMRAICNTSSKPRLLLFHHGTEAVASFLKNVGTRECHSLCASGHSIPRWFSPEMFVLVVNLSPQGLLTRGFPVGYPSACALFHFQFLCGILPPPLHWMKPLSQQNLLQLLFLLFPLPCAHSCAQGLDPLQASPPSLLFF